MRAKRPVVFALLVCVAAMFSPFPGLRSAGAASNPPGWNVSYSIVPVSFVMSPTQCPSISVTVSGSTAYHNTTYQQVNSDGSTHTIINSVASGFATDNMGGYYYFTYRNVSNQAAAPSGYPLQLWVTDTFTLQGSGSASGLHVDFTQFVTVTDPNSPPIVNVIHADGNPNCDPI